MAVIKIMDGAKAAKNNMKHNKLDGRCHREVMAAQADLTSKENSDQIISVNNYCAIGTTGFGRSR